MTLIIHYLKLCRPDAALISFFTYIIGAEIGGKAGISDVVTAFFVTIISTNFIYSFNAWTDRDIDRINKGYRPIPSGKIHAPHAFTYAMVLLCLSVVYPFFIYKTPIQLCLFLLLPLLGLLYSAEPFRFRKNPYLATITISTGLNIPILLGYVMNSDLYTHIPFFFSLFLYCLAVIPLKQIEEVKEDHYKQVVNLYTRYGQSVIRFSLTGLFLNVIIVEIIVADIRLRLFAMMLNITTLMVILIFRQVNGKLNQLYTLIIRTVIAESVVLFFLLKRLG